ncbi:3-deoxy-7-phosphoheptulonate synthase [Arcanobacterium pinnipediorum]|uniref:Phospho-2-dehydro-3-deoxyheptonate aldolase n=1 Tax=Arcanobacterium pinnipediorum TaxID=1503041 RepID=A0ABY5ALM5_9ACTO|nr:3-deoxy-7-phosphoheptulonate synthase [Arcanobacterium pinnipediorum]USR80108.1 3-deoxy-7-phosphoheptulonate synthase [Arcanobacterium pinnipediorum]
MTHRDIPQRFLPIYPDQDQVDISLDYIRRQPPIVATDDIGELTNLLGDAGRGQVFVIQGGDCAERFSDTTRSHVRAKIGSLLQAAFIAHVKGQIPVVTVGRIAGQYAKPRSLAYEDRDGISLPSYRGDAVNSHVFTAQARTPDPQRLVRAVENAARAYRYIQDLEKSPFVSSRCALEWNTASNESAQYKEFEQLVGASRPEYAQRIFISHESLLPFYEQAMTDEAGYNRGAHMLWIGERTRYISSPQIAYAQQVNNPIGIKLGPKARPSDIHDLIQALNPHGSAGRLSFIPRMGAHQLRNVLPQLIRAGVADGRPVSWIIDPMHGNTLTYNGRKMRFLTDIIQEIHDFFEVCAAEGIAPAGIHIEFSGENLMEIADSREYPELDEILDEALVDPRLNPRQLFDVAFATSQLLAKQY